MRRGFVDYYCDNAGCRLNGTDDDKQMSFEFGEGTVPSMLDERHSTMIPGADEYESLSTFDFEDEDTDAEPHNYVKVVEESATYDEAVEFDWAFDAHMDGVR